LSKSGALFLRGWIRVSGSEVLPEVAAIEGSLYWFLHNRGEYRALVIHSDSTSAIARAGHTGAGPGQAHAIRIQKWVFGLQNLRHSTTVNVEWVKGHAGIPGNERADKLAGEGLLRRLDRTQTSPSPASN